MLPLSREVQPPRTAAGLWPPFMALALAATLTIVSGIAVMARAPHVVHVVPAKPHPLRTDKAKIDRLVKEVLGEAPPVHEPALQRVNCSVKLPAGEFDGRVQLSDDCIAPSRPTADVEAQ